jgi:hypothetical protein
MKTYTIAMLAAAAIVFSCENSAALAEGSATTPCQANPGPSATDKTLAEQLDECNGVLTPPKVGDSEIVEPPRDTGTIIVIPPGALPEQESEAQPEPATQSQTAESAQYDIAEIVEAISCSQNTAGQAGALPPPFLPSRPVRDASPDRNPCVDATYATAPGERMTMGPLLTAAVTDVSD